MEKSFCLLAPRQLLAGLKSSWIKGGIGFGIRGALWSFWNKQVLLIEIVAWEII